MSDPEEANSAWAEQVGRAYTREAVADLLRITPQAVADRKGLLELEQRNGRIVHPAFQFEGRTVLAGVPDVVRIMAPVVATSWTIAALLTSPQTDLGGRSPVEVLRDGGIEDVTLLARPAANVMSR